MTARHTVAIRCDGEDCTLGGLYVQEPDQNLTEDELREKLIEEGWEYKDGKDYCVGCWLQIRVQQDKEIPKDG